MTSEPAEIHKSDSVPVTPLSRPEASEPFHTPLTSLVGREKEVDAVKEFVLDPAIRLITLTGPGGVGKTRLGLEAAESMQTDFPGGVVFVDLTTIKDPRLLTPTIVETLGIREGDDRRALDRMKEHFGARAVLLVLDNFEHILPAAPSVSDLLHVCPGLTAIVTSRSVLNISGEWVLQVSPLTVPYTARERSHQGNDATLDYSPADLLDFEAIQLFVERAAAINPEFELTSGNARAVQEICVRLEGIPLAIELAAARSAIFTPADMLEKLGARLPMLTGGPRDLPDRQRTMRDAIAWSYDLLATTEQAVFRRLAVFVGGCNFKAAETVCTGSGSDYELEAETVLAALESLARQSMIKVVHPDRAHDAGGETRVRLLDVIREFAAEKLAESGEQDRIDELHATFYRGVAERLESMLWGDTIGEPRGLIGIDLGNYLAALDWAMKHPSADLALQMVATFFDPGEYQDLHRLLGLDTYQQVDIVRDVLEMPGGTPALRVSGLCKASYLADQHGDVELARLYAEEAVELAREQDDTFLCAIAAFVRGRCAFRSDDLDNARSWLNESMSGFQELGASSRFAMAECILASLECQVATKGVVEDREAYERAAALCDSALATYRSIGFQRGIERAMSGRAYVAYKQQDWDLSLSMTTELLAQSLQDGRIVLHYIEDIADIAAHVGSPALAARLYGSISEERERYGIIVPQVFQEEVEQEIAEIRHKLGDAEFTHQTELGCNTSIEQAIAEALEFAEKTLDSTSITLTPREEQVLPLLAKNKTSREIGEELFLSHRTVETHIANIYNKLQVQNREEAIVAASEAGLLG